MAASTKSIFYCFVLYLTVLLSTPGTAKSVSPPSSAALVLADCGHEKPDKHGYINILTTLESWRMELSENGIKNIQLICDRKLIDPILDEEWQHITPTEQRLLGKYLWQYKKEKVIDTRISAAVAKAHLPCLKMELTPQDLLEDNFWTDYDNNGKCPEINRVAIIL